MPARCTILPIVLLTLLVVYALPAVADEPVLFESQVRPILKARCLLCHGEEPEPKGELDLRLARLIVRGGESGAAIVPGKHAESLMWQRIDAGEMPPGEKKLSDREKQTIARWIDQGAKTARPEPEAVAAHGIEATDEEKSFWSFQPIRRPAVPSVKSAGQVANPIDAFLLSRLEAQKLGYSPPADRRMLIRRATFDLLGLPPTPEEVAAFDKDDAPGAYERLIERLLASPHYGEHWSRHWLDVAGYADSDGYTDKDIVRPYAYKYRDYLIRAVNADRPWDELIREQLAGDELVKPPYAELKPDELDKLVATGFLRMGPDGTGDTTVEADLSRNDVMVETIKIVSTSLLGLTVGCAQCHVHRYDPISQVDYYRLRAIFEPAYDWKDWKPSARKISLLTAAKRKRMAEIDLETKRLEKERLAKLTELAEKIAAAAIAEAPEELREKLEAARKVEVNKRNAEQKKLFKDYPRADAGTGNLATLDKAGQDAILAEYKEPLEKLKAERPVEDYLHCLTETPGKQPQTFLFHRGDFHQPKEVVEPGELSVLASADTSPVVPLDDPKLPTTGRRLAYARHLTNGRHPLVARVLVNRVWMHHFGKGLVATPSDFGVLGDRPSHPELLDWLADEFMTPASGHPGWRMKTLHRLLMTSTAYQQISRRADKLDAVDPDNRLLGRMSVRRLTAEELRDAILATSGQLSRKLHGPPVPVTPDEVGQIVLGVDTRDGAGRFTGKKVPLGEEEFRRSVYVQVRRSQMLSMLDAFDAPILSPNCEQRNSSTVAPQSLLLMNNDLVVRQSEKFAERVAAELPDDLDEQVRLAWRLAFAQQPSTEQVSGAREYIAGQQTDFATAKAADPARQALASFCQALLMSNGFLYID